MVGRIDRSDALRDLDQALFVERQQAHLDRPWIVEAHVVVKVRVQPRRERGCAAHALRSIEERRGARDEQIQPRVVSTADRVDELPKRVQALLATVTAHPLDRLDLVEDEHQPWPAGLLQQQEQPAQEGERANEIFDEERDKDKAKPIPTVKVDLRLHGRELETPAQLEALLKEIETRLAPLVGEKKRVRLVGAADAKVQASCSLPSAGRAPAAATCHETYLLRTDL